MEAPWWETNELIADPRFKDASWCPGYADYEAVMTVDEARTLAAKYAPNATLDHLMERNDDLDRKFADGNGSVTRIKILVYEWKSGF